MDTGVYSNLQIYDAIKNGHIVFHPYTPEHINGSSIDVTLGEWFYRTDRKTGSTIYNPYDEHAVHHYFGDPQQATPHKQWCEKHGFRLLSNIPDDHPIIVLAPGERILAHTHEFIGIKGPGTTSMQARSSTGRNGIAVCFDAGWGDPGYINRWTMEIYNLNTKHSVVLPVGERVAQLVFFHTGEVEEDYSKLSGKYQSSSDLVELIKHWRPEDMLPRSYKDKRQLPRAI
ncbi:dCTP deaminase [Candidatus Saccharibacteria bacterium]|nr:dCTP deaminase [Candidatus Saccharibacteria bacterium]